MDVTSIAWALVREVGQTPVWWDDVPDGLPDDWLEDWLAGQVPALWEIGRVADASPPDGRLVRIVETRTTDSKTPSLPVDPASPPSGAVDEEHDNGVRNICLTGGARQSLTHWSSTRGRAPPGFAAAADLSVWCSGNTLWARPVPAGRTWSLPVWRELLTELEAAAASPVTGEVLHTLVVGVDLPLARLSDCMVLSDLLGMRRLQSRSS